MQAELVKQHIQTPMISAENFGSEMFKICLTFFVFLFLLKRLSMKFKKRLPPGPPKFPIIGNMDKLTGLAPHRSLRDLSLKYGPLMHLKLGSVSTIVISSAELAKEVMKTHDLAFASRPKIVSAKILGYNYSDVALTPYGSYWRMLRKICILELLSLKRVQSYRFVREEELALLVQSIASSRATPVNLAEALFTYNHDVTTRITFGKKSDDPLRFKAAMKEGVLLAGGFHIGDFFPSLEFVSSITGMKARLEKNFLELDSILSKIVGEHVQKHEMDQVEHEDLVDVLLRVKNNEELEMPLTNDNIKAVILDLFVGGTENSSNTTEWAMAEMMKNSTIMEKAQAEVRRVVGGKPAVEESDLHKLTYMKLVIKETLRLHTPLALLIPRESMETCTINGYEIPAKTRAIVNYWAIAMDPLSWKDPEIFNPERFIDNSIEFNGKDFEFIPFGAGRRICPGISFAVCNIELALASLLYHFDWKLPNDMKIEDLDMDETFALTLSKRNNLHLVPSLHFK